MDPMLVNTANATRIAFASSATDGRDRWTELSVFWFDPPMVNRRRWLVEARGRSVVPGEVTKVRRATSSHIEKALGFFDDTDLAQGVRIEAREWMQEHGLDERGNISVAEQAARDAYDRLPVAEPVPEDERALIGWLFGNRNTSTREAAERLGVGESRIRMALRDGRPLMVALRSLLPFVNRDAFRKTLEDRDGE